jgi:hypothetical protein
LLESLHFPDHSAGRIREGLFALEEDVIGKETERRWEQAEDISTLLPSLLRYQNRGVVGEQLRQRLRQIPTGIS